MTPIGSRGDVQPFVALGKGLQAEGHVVRIATHAIHSEMVRANGLDFAPIEGNPREMFETLTGQAWLDSGKNILKFWREFRKLAGVKFDMVEYIKEDKNRDNNLIDFIS